MEIHGTNAQVECQSCGQRGDPGPAMEAFRREIAVGWDQLDAGHVADFDPDAVNRALDAEA